MAVPKMRDCGHKAERGCKKCRYCFECCNGFIGYFCTRWKHRKDKPQ